ncbi:glycosyltransferase [Ammoniphilus sp. YIM 78166]|uniref:glycosyltransferase n=1 Tax=Ammoniphilus sp. YIM 78166 TaxID=1644106 RepID=UPI00107061AA|nr:glycosyltransferase [Ammoniphilus sp. YIM 78166]
MMKKKILLSSFDMAIGGVERSLIGLLSQIDYDKYDVDLMLFKHEGEFLPLLPQGPTLLPEIPTYTTFRMPILQTLREGHLPIALTRLLARYLGSCHGLLKRCDEPGYLAIQYGWALSKPYLPQLNHTKYDLAISFLWPHYFVGHKVQAKRKVGWIHTDYSKIAINKSVDKKMWDNLDKIIAVSEECKNSFLKMFPEYSENTLVIENILSPNFVWGQSNQDISPEMPETPGRTKLLTVGRLTFAKGMDDAVRACRRLLDIGLDIEWYVVGYGPLESELQDLIKQYGVKDRFKLLGKKTNPYPYIKACDIYVQPSRYEGKAVTVREAQILAKPVLITNFPTAKSQVRDGIDGLITGMGVEGIVSGLQKLIEDKELTNRLISNTMAADYGNNSEIEKLYALIS